MRSSTASLAAALAVFSVNGPFTTAEAAPARQYEEQERPKYYYPRQVKRQLFSNSTSSFLSAVESSLAAEVSNIISQQTDSSSLDPSSSAEVSASPSSSSVNMDSVIASLISVNELPQTENTVVTTIYTEHQHNNPFAPEIATFTLTYTETSSPASAPTEESAPVFFTGTAPSSVILPTAPSTSPAAVQTSSSSWTHDSRSTYDSTALPSSVVPSSSAVPSSSGFLNSIMNSILESGIIPTASGSGTVSIPVVQPTAASSSDASVSSNSAVASQSASSNGIFQSTVVGLTGTVDQSTATIAAEPTLSTDQSSFSLPISLPPLTGGITLPSSIMSLLPTGVPLSSDSPVVNATSSTPTAVFVSTTSSDVPDISSVVASMSSEASAVQSSVFSDISSIASVSSSVPAAATTAASAALSNLASQISSDLSSILATASGVQSALSSEFSVVLSTVASNVASELSSLIPTTATPSITLTGTAPLTSTTVTGTDGRSSVLPVPIPTSAASAPTYSLSTSGTAVIPISVSKTSNATSGDVSISTSIPLSSGDVSISTSIPLASGITATLNTSGSFPTFLPTLSMNVSSSDSSVHVSSEPTVSTTSSASASLRSSASITMSTATARPSPAVSNSSQPPSTASVAETSSKSLSSASSSSTTAPISIAATGADSATTMMPPTSIVYAPTTPPGTIATAATSSSASQGLPTYMPRLIQPPGGLPEAPSNKTLVQLGFNYGLNYPFVVSTENATSQIFAYLPQGIAYGLSIDQNNVVMNALMPYDTTGSLGYITTLAQAYIPSDMVTSLQQALHSPVGPLYSNPDSPIKTLMGMINVAIPLIPGPALDATTSAGAYNPGATTSSSAGDGAPIGGDSGTSQSVKGSSVGIGIGAVCGAAVYAVAMVYVARRYRQKRRSHQRSSSVEGMPQMREQSTGGMGGYTMAGANGRYSDGRYSDVPSSSVRGSRNSAGTAGGSSSNGRSVREQGISNPITSENSLGWS
ncbi:Hypothetical protein R9X50_00215800 [Acrodontium crateriforme]|uniref:Basic proline-rich protein n=1 Tax=Acrodontium crateriforme TaxID=150365 RepID=A0AAQ3M1Z3_9PEZI|nr:Hypothetical protein R9X50_00215800 [Acrodontium crateriforme]